jgi:hypothetical protein
MRKPRVRQWALPEPVSGIFPAEPARQPRLERVLRRVRRELDVEVAAVLDLSGETAELCIDGALLELTPQKEALLMLWMQELETARVRSTPPKLLLVFGCLDVLCVPIQTPAGRWGAFAVSLTRRVLRSIGTLERIAAETALEMEASMRVVSTESTTEIPTLPAPPIDVLDDVA